MLPKQYVLRHSGLSRLNSQPTKRWLWPLAGCPCPHLLASSSSQVNISPCTNYHHQAGAPIASTTNPNPATTCQGPHRVPLSWAGRQSYSKCVGLQQSQHPLIPTSVAAERYPGTGVHALLFLRRRTKAPRIPVEALPRLPGHRTHQKEFGSQNFLGITQHPFTAVHWPTPGPSLFICSTDWQVFTEGQVLR